MNALKFKTTILGIGVLLSTFAFAQKGKDKSAKNKFLEGKKYDVQFYEIKPTGRGNAIPGTIVIKKGEVQSDLMEDKLKAPAMAYKITVDSTYADKTDEDGAEIHLINFNGDFTEDKNEYKWEATISNYSIEGTCIALKSGVQKKKFEFEGEEKAAKK